jgi:uncharacterized hydrophobic protein (TIGR00271 family)
MTLHVRVISPPELTELLVDALVADSGVSNLMVLTGSARRPYGDAVHFDMLTRSANSVLRQLRALGGDHRSSIVIENVDAAIGEGVYPAAKQGLVQRDSASQILIVGAMVVGPEYNAIMGIALGIDKRDRRAILQGNGALLAGFSAAIIVTFVFSLAIRWSGHTPEAFSLGLRPVSSLIDKPNLFSVVVAVLAGIVGVVSLTESRASTLIGVFISVTTIPAAADIALSLAYASWTGHGVQHCSCC